MKNISNFKCFCYKCHSRNKQLFDIEQSLARISRSKTFTSLGIAVFAEIIFVKKPQPIFFDSVYNNSIDGLINGLLSKYSTKESLSLELQVRTEILMVKNKKILNLE